MQKLQDTHSLNFSLDLENYKTSLPDYDTNFFAYPIRSIVPIHCAASSFGKSQKGSNQNRSFINSINLIKLSIRKKFSPLAI